MLSSHIGYYYPTAATFFCHCTRKESNVLTSLCAWINAFSWLYLLLPAQVKDQQQEAKRRGKKHDGHSKHKHSAKVAATSTHTHKQTCKKCIWQNEFKLKGWYKQMKLLKSNIVWHSFSSPIFSLVIPFSLLLSTLLHLCTSVCLLKLKFYLQMIGHPLKEMWWT